MATTEENNHSPLTQFEIHSIIDLQPGGLNISFTNSSFAMVATVVFITLFLTLTVKKRSLVPSRLQLISESIYSLYRNCYKTRLAMMEENIFHLYSASLCLY